MVQKMKKNYHFMFSCVHESLRYGMGNDWRENGNPQLSEFHSIRKLGKMKKKHMGTFKKQYSQPPSLQKMLHYLVNLFPR